MRDPHKLTMIAEDETVAGQRRKAIETLLLPQNSNNLGSRVDELVQQIYKYQLSRLGHTSFREVSHLINELMRVYPFYSVMGRSMEYGDINSHNLKYDCLTLLVGSQFRNVFSQLQVDKGIELVAQYDSNLLLTCCAPLVFLSVASLLVVFR